MVRVVLSELHLIRTSVFYVTFSLLLFHIILGEGWPVFRPEGLCLPSNASKELKFLFLVEYDVASLGNWFRTFETIHRPNLNLLKRNGFFTYHEV